MKKKFNIKNIIKIFTVVYVCYVLLNQQITINRQKKELGNINVESQKKKEENKILKDEVELSKDDKYIERLAREKLGFIKEGETPVLDNKN